MKVPKTGGIPTTKASVLRWLKSEGDSVQVGEPVVELETEKVSYELESPIAGVLLRIIARESVQVPVGGPLCDIGQPEDRVPRSDDESDGGATGVLARPPGGRAGTPDSLPAELEKEQDDA